MSAKPNHVAARLRFRDLQLLAALGDGNSLRNAAHILNVTQPALSRTLTEIEVTFGCRLFERSARGLVPTQQGAAAVRGARQLLGELERVGEEIELSAEFASVIRIGAPHFVAHGHLPTLMTRVQDAGVAPRLQLIEGAAHDLFHKLLEGEVDALITTYADRPLDEARLTYERLFPSRYVLIAPAGAQWLPRNRIAGLQDFARIPWILPAYTSMLRKDIDKAFLGAGMSPPRPVVESNNPYTNLHFVAAGCGLAFVPVETLRHIRPGLLQQVPVSPPLSTGPVALIYLAGAKTTQLNTLRLALGLHGPVKAGGNDA